MKILGREPALWFGFATALLQLLSLFIFGWTDEVQGAVNAVIAGILGVVTAAMTKFEKLAPAILGLAQALVSCGLAFGLELTAGQQSAIMAFTAAAVGMFLRTQITPKVSRLESNT